MHYRESETDYGCKKQAMQCLSVSRAYPLTSKSGSDILMLTLKTESQSSRAVLTRTLIVGDTLGVTIC